MKKHTFISIIGWILIGALLLFWQERHLAFHYAYIEQFRLFHFNMDYLLNQCSYPSGFMEYVASFLIQYFNLPWVGSLVTTLLFVSIGIGVQQLLRYIAPKVALPLAYLLPPLLLLFAGMDFYYHLEGTLAYCLMVWLLNAQIRIVHPSYRLASGTILSWLLFYLAGPAFLPFCICAILYEWYKHSPFRIYSLLLLPIACIPAYYTYFTGIGGEARIVFLPDAYTNPRLQATDILYAPWMLLPVLLILAGSCRKWCPSVPRWVSVTSISIQLMIAVGILYQGNEKYNSPIMNEAKVVDYYSRNQKWDSLLALQLRANENSLLACFQNLALAQKGMLADKGLHYKQLGNKGLWIDWNQSVTVCTLLSDLYYAIGHIALSQRYAFEGIIASEWSVNPYLFLRLIQTNLIYGHYEVAQKYIERLKDTRYQAQADAYRPFLYNDEKIAQDSELGSKRLGISQTEGLSEMTGLPNDLLQIARANPNNRTVFAYIGMYILFEKDIPLFRNFIENFHQTPGLQPMPTHFQEAIIIAFEAHPDKWESYGVTEKTRKRFEEFRKITIENKRNPALINKLRTGYGNTYWYYYIYNK